WRSMAAAAIWWWMPRPTMPSTGACSLRARSSSVPSLTASGCNLIPWPAQTIMHDGRQALQFPFPHALRRIQRRDHFRVDIPVSAPLWCQVPASEKTTETLRVKDISAGGLALFDPETLVDAGVGSRLEACTLELPDIGTITFTLTV